MEPDKFNKDESESQERLPEDGYCTSCEAKGEITKYWYNRCTNENCPVLTFMP